MKCGLSVFEFWDSTPREVHAVIEAFTWNVERKNKSDAWVVWHIAALSRAKRLPPLKRLMSSGKPGKSKRLEGKELDQRRLEHQEIMAKIDMTKINEAKQKKVKRRGS